MVKVTDGTRDIIVSTANTGRAFVSTGANIDGANKALNEGNTNVDLEMSKVGQSIADTGVSGASIITDIGKKGEDGFFVKGAGIMGGLGGLVSGWGVKNDLATIGKTMRGDDGSEAGFGSVKVSDSLSLAGNALGVVAGVVAIGVATATAPAWAPAVGVVAGLGSLGLGVASLYTSYQHGDLTLSDVKDIVIGTANQAYQNVSESFREFMGKVGDKFLETVLENDKKFSDFVKKVGETFANTQTFVDKLSEFLEPVAEFARDIAGIKDDASDYDDTISKIKEIFEKIFENAKEGRDNLIEKILDLPDYIADQLPKWLGLNRNGKHYFYDPLVLDLDGDGIETLGHNKKLGAMFDFDNDGVKVATGWVKADDGIINNGGELFGDYTDLKDGTKAKHGFNALADLDSNNDGKITKDDENFAKLKVWRDLNQNGISEADELIGLDTLDITALNIDYQDTNQSLAGGNVLAQLGSYEKGDGSIGTMGDVNFAFNHLYSVYNRDISSNHPQSLPIDMKGSGFVPDLAIAITKSAELKQIVERYVLGGKQEQEALMYGLLKAWAMTDPNYKEFDDSIRMSEVVAADTAGAVAIAGTQSATLLVLSDETTRMFNDAKSKIGIIDSFLGTKTDKLYYITEDDVIATATVINEIYDKISSSVYHGLYHQVLYAKYTPLFDMIIDVNDDTIDIRYGIETINNEMALKLAQGDDKAGWALVDALELINYLNANHPTIDNSALFQVVHQFAYNKTDQELQVWLDKLSHFAKQNQVLNIGRDGDDYLTGNLVYGHDGHDYIAGKNGTNWLYGGQGNDALQANQANDVLDGGDGDDNLNSGMGNDILIGGNGNDYLTNYGYGNGADTYIFSGNYGNDRINDNDWNLGENRHKDIVRFTDVKFEDVRLELSLNNRDLIIHTGNSNSLTIEYAVNSDSYVIENFEFMDKAVTFEELYSKKVADIQGADTNDYFYFSNWKGEINGNLGDGDDYFQANTKSTIDGGAGNDTLNGSNFNDVFNGGKGNDTINSGFGDDTLIGSEGNDYLNNYGYGNGADTYVFFGNYGHDKINDYDWNLGEGRHKDTVLFTDVNFTDVMLEVSSNGHDLILHTGNDNSLTIEYAVNNDSYAIESFEFADRAVTFEELKQSIGTIL